MIQESKMALGDFSHEGDLLGQSVLGALQALYICQQYSTSDVTALGCPQPISKPTVTTKYLGPFWTTEPRQRGAEPSRFE